MARALQLPHQILKILRRSAFDRDCVTRSWMNKLKIRGMQRDSVNQLFFGFFAMVFSIADERMAYGGKLCPNLVLQSCDQFYAEKCRVGKRSIHGIA